ncbi:MAG: DUF5069 domain-containing protein [Candidatus Sericytochromatia bacterium]|nr:DUF5069 domain-containing protein [Candidatus Tanganyikabacteria bacterium]
MQAPDLAKSCPRSPLDRLGDLPWLPRLIDKARAHLAGTMGDYIPYPCGGDQRFLDTFGLDANALLGVIGQGLSDEAVAEWVRLEATEDLQEGVRVLLAHFEAPIPPDDADRLFRLQQARAELQQARPDLDLTWVDNFTKLILAEEGHPRLA